MSKTTKTASKPKYAKMKHLDHILNRSDMYVGSIIPEKINTYIADSTGQYNIYSKEINCSPALLRIFVEPLSNAVDNVSRSLKTTTPCTTIKVNVDRVTGETSVWNDGESISIEMNEEEQCYNHTMIFGQLLTSSNYDDNEERVDISGRNGMGIKVCNVFSSKFNVTAYDPENEKLFSQSWCNNMKTVTEPKITKTKKYTKGFTCVTWTPDFKRLGFKEYTQDIVDLYCKYVIDTSMLTKIKVYFNNKLLPVTNLKDYSKLYFENGVDEDKEEKTKEIVIFKTNTAEVALTPSNGEYETISFASGVYTCNGGTHVNAWSEEIFRPLVKHFNKANKPQITIKDIKQFFRLFVVASVKNPVFDSQEKSVLKSPAVTATVSAANIKQILKWSVIDNIEEIIRSKEMLTLKKSERKKKGFTKVDGLDSANNAGGKLSHECTLIICEGLSAKTYAVQGIEVGVFDKKGRDWFGIYPLKGKCLNVRDKQATTIAKNAVINDLIKALGARYGVDYTNDKEYKTLQYGKIMILTDADCFTKDSAVIVKNKNTGVIDIMSVKQLNEIDYSIYMIWSYSVWTNILGVMKKPTSKCILEINTQQGIITVTEDHKCILQNGSEILAKNLRVGDKLLHNDIQKNSIRGGVKGKVTMNVKKIEAHIWGLIFAEGDWNNDMFEISNVCRDMIEILRNILEHYYKNIEIELVEISVMEDIVIYKLLIDTKSERNQEFMEILKKFYIKGDKLLGKKVPLEILNSNISIQKSFFGGFCDGYESRLLILSQTIKTFDIKGQIAVQGICMILDQIDETYSLSYSICQSHQGDMYTINLSSKNDTNTFGEIKSIRQIKYTDKYVYDIETENHMLNVGIGNVIVHNCDGIHISGLIQNSIHSLFPTLIERKDPFIVSMQTPIVRVFLSNKNSILFYNEEEYKAYVQKYSNKYPNKKIDKKYYKGLGTSSENDIIETFGKKMLMLHSDINLLNTMNKVFHKKKADIRKEWIASYDPDNITLRWNGSGYEEVNMEISKFLDTEVIKFSINDCKRSIPHSIDGLKESLRKVLYSCFLKNLKYSGKTLKVAQLAGYVAEKSCYHHGEQNLYETITKMANEFPGSNNIPLLYRDGQFGSKLAGGKDAANARYIYTKLEKLTRLIFRPEDDPLLELVEDDGDIVEPKFYVPIIPMILVNGGEGIGTGWSTSVPSYNPLELVDAIKIWLDNDGKIITKEDNLTISLLPDINPWYRGYTGRIEKDRVNRYISYGRIVEDKKKKIVEELPVFMWTDNFKESLDTYLEEKLIKSVKNYSTPKDVKFVITESQDGFICNEKTLKLHTYIKTSNMVLFTTEGNIKKFTSIDEIINYFCEIRFEYYIKRKKYILDKYNTEVKYLGNKKRFLEEVMNGTLKLYNKNISREEADIIQDLEKRKFDKELKPVQDKDKDDEVEENGKESGYDYLLRMQIRSFTASKIITLKNDITSIEKKINEISSTSEKQMWLNDLDAFSKGYMVWLKDIEKEKVKVRK